MTPSVPFVGFTSTHGNHWSVGLESTWVSPDHVVPPFPDVSRKTSVLVTGFAESCVPFRLSEKTRASLPFSDARGLATRLPTDHTRTWYPVNVCRPSTLSG